MRRACRMSAVNMTCLYSSRRTCAQLKLAMVTFHLLLNYRPCSAEMLIPRPNLWNSRNHKKLHVPTDECDSVGSSREREGRGRYCRRLPVNFVLQMLQMIFHLVTHDGELTGNDVLQDLKPSHVRCLFRKIRSSLLLTNAS